MDMVSYLSALGGNISMWLGLCVIDISLLLCQISSLIINIIILRIRRFEFLTFIKFIKMKEFMKILCLVLMVYQLKELILEFKQNNVLTIIKFQNYSQFPNFYLYYICSLLQSQKICYFVKDYDKCVKQNVLKGLQTISITYDIILTNNTIIKNIKPKIFVEFELLRRNVDTRISLNYKFIDNIDNDLIDKIEISMKEQLKEEPFFLLSFQIQFWISIFGKEYQ